MPDWVSATLGDIGTPLIGLTYKPKDVAEQGTLVLRSSNVQDGQLDLKDRVYVTSEIPSRIRLQHGDVLICVRNGSRPLIGKSLFVEGPVVGQTFGAFMSVYRSDLNDYLRFFFQSEEFKAQVDSHLGATINQITNASLKSFKVRYPQSSADREAISKALRDADKQVVLLQDLIDKKHNVLKGAMQSLLSGEKRLPGFQTAWADLNVASTSHIKARIGWQGLTTSEYLEHGHFRLVGGTDFSDGRVDWQSVPYVDSWRYEQDKNIQLQIGDVLVTKDGTLGKIAFIDSLPGPATLNSGVFVIRPNVDSYHSGFLYWLLRSEMFSKFISGLSAGSTIIHLYQKDLKTLVFGAPTEYAEQASIAQVLFDFESEIKVLEQKLKSYRNLRTGLMQGLLSGELSSQRV
jgi:type I restriction enzyme S subunit